MRSISFSSALWCVVEAMCRPLDNDSCCSNASKAGSPTAGFFSAWCNGNFYQRTSLPVTPTYFSALHTFVFIRISEGFDTYSSSVSVDYYFSCSEAHVADEFRIVWFSRLSFFLHAGMQGVEDREFAASKPLSQVTRCRNHSFTVCFAQKAERNQNVY